LRVRALSAVVCSSTILATFATPALAGETGGAAAGGAAASPPAPGPAPTATLPAAAPRIHTAPVTTRSFNLIYKGPVFQKTVTGAIVPYVPPAVASRLGAETGGSPVGVAAVTKPELLVPGSTARFVAGLAAAPMSVPAAVQQMIWTANQIIGLPYIYGGGHQSFESPGYDCSGTVSYALHGASLLTIPEDSSELMAWGARGLGRWVTTFSNPAHAYMTVAGLRLDTSAADDPSNQQGPRWRPLRAGNGGYTVRHPVGL
jgi:cell wall-associated NlpC family hydrolase